MDKMILDFFVSRSPCRVVVCMKQVNALRLRELFILLNFRSNNYKELRVDPYIITKSRKDGTVCPISYIKGIIYSHETVETTLGHHVAPKDVGKDRIPFQTSDLTMAIIDDPSLVITVRTWASLIILKEYDNANRQSE